MRRSSSPLAGRRAVLRETMPTLGDVVAYWRESARGVPVRTYIVRNTADLPNEDVIPPRVVLARELGEAMLLWGIAQYGPKALRDVYDASVSYLLYVANRDDRLRPITPAEFLEELFSYVAAQLDMMDWLEIHEDVPVARIENTLPPLAK